MKKNKLYTILTISFISMFSITACSKPENKNPEETSLVTEVIRETDSITENPVGTDLTEEEENGTTNKDVNLKDSMESNKSEVLETKQNEILETSEESNNSQNNVTENKEEDNNIITYNGIYSGVLQDGTSEKLTINNYDTLGFDFEFSGWITGHAEFAEDGYAYFYDEQGKGINFLFDNTNIIVGGVYFMEY